MFRVPSICSQSQKISLKTSLFTIWVSFQVLNPIQAPQNSYKYWWWFYLYSGFLQAEKGVIEYWLLFSSFGNYGLSQYNVSEKIEELPIRYSGICVFPFISLHWNRVYLRSTSCIGRILPYSRLKYARLDLWSIEDACHHLVWWIVRSRYFGFEKTSLAESSESVSTSLFLSRSSPDAGNPNKKTTTHWYIRSTVLSCTPPQPPL